MPIIESIEKVDDQEFKIQIETEEVTVTGSPFDASRGITDKVEAALDAGLVLARSVAKKVTATVGSMQIERPDELEIQFSIGITSEMGAFIAKASTTGQLQVKMKWDLKKK